MNRTKSSTSAYSKLNIECHNDVDYDEFLDEWLISKVVVTMHDVDI